MSNAEVEVGTCEVCGAKNVKLERTYFDFPNVKCLCHSPNHFELITHCKNCIPNKPNEIKVIFSLENMEKINDLLKEE